MQDVHSILSKTHHLFCYMFFVDHTNLAMITRIFCQLMRAYDRDKILEKLCQMSCLQHSCDLRQSLVKL